MDAQQALADLTEISSQIQAAVVIDDTGKVAASTLGDPLRSDELAKAAGGLLTAADEIKTGESALTQLEVATGEGSVFVVRLGKTVIAATTGNNPTAGPRLLRPQVCPAYRQAKLVAKLRATKQARGGEEEDGDRTEEKDGGA